MPMDARVTKIVASEISEDDMPITSAVVILERIYQNAYPYNMEVAFSI